MTDVEQLLQDKEIQFHPKGKDLLIVCLNPEHDDSNPSMRVDREDGQFHCFSCGYKGNVFTRFNRFRNVFNSRVKQTKETIEDLRKASWSGYPYPRDAFFVTTEFRGISPETMQKFHAFRSKEHGMEERIVFPIFDSREIIIGFQGRYEFSDAKPKYLAYPRGQSLPLYPNPQRITPINNSIILVEGLLDALYLHSRGLTNVVAIFGTSRINYDNVIDLLTPYMLLGCDKVYLMMDGDKAGRKANNNIEKCIKHKTDLLVEQLAMEDDTDPAELSDEQIDILRKYLLNN